MEVLYVSNNVEDWGNNPAISSDNTKFDENRVPYAITMVRETVIGMKSLCVVPSGNITWFHFRAKFNSNQGSPDDGPMLAIRQADGTLIAELKLLNGAGAAKVYGDTTVTGSHVTTLTSANILEFDLKLEVDGSNITMDYYLDQTLTSTATAANTGGLTVARHLQFVCQDIVPFKMSEFVVAADDTRNVRMDRVDPTTAGNYTAWNGAVADLFDDDDSTSMFTDTATNRTSANTDTYAGGDSITSVVLQSRASAGVDAPQTLTQFLRISATDYDGSTQTLTNGVENYIENYELDPSDALAWDTAGVNAVEVGLLASA